MLIGCLQRDQPIIRLPRRLGGYPICRLPGLATVGERPALDFAAGPTAHTGFAEFHMEDAVLVAHPGIVAVTGARLQQRVMAGAAGAAEERRAGESEDEIAHPPRGKADVDGRRIELDAALVFSLAAGIDRVDMQRHAHRRECRARRRLGPDLEILRQVVRVSLDAGTSAEQYGCRNERRITHGYRQNTTAASQATIWVSCHVP